MNAKTNRRFGLYLPLSILLATVACTLRTVAAFLGIDEYGYFGAEVLNNVSAWILVSAILIMLTYPLVYAKRPEVLVRHTTPLTFIPSLLSGLVLIFFVGEMGKSLYTTLLPLNRVIFLILFILGIFSALYFFSLAVVESGVSDKKANYGMVLVLTLGVYAALLYLDTSAPRNAPTELAEEMTLIALSLFFLYEIRISLDKPKQNLYVCFGFIAALLSAYTALPSLIYYIASGTLLLSSLSILLLILALFIFTVARLYLFNVTPDNEACAMVRALCADASEREKEVRELEALYAPPEPEPEPDEEAECAPEGESEIEEAEGAPESEENDQSEAPEIVPEIPDANAEDVEADTEQQPTSDEPYLTSEASQTAEAEGNVEEVDAPASPSEQAPENQVEEGCESTPIDGNALQSESPELVISGEAQEELIERSDDENTNITEEAPEESIAAEESTQAEDTTEEEAAIEASDSIEQTESAARTEAPQPTPEGLTPPESEASDDASTEEKGEENEENSGH